MTLPLNILPFVHHLLSQPLQNGDCAVDATMGNGHDTLHLAQCVGETGKVWAFDVQESAIQTTQQKLKQHQLQNRVELILDGHQNIHRYIQQSVDAGVFNLGYLPNGDKNMTTHSETSLIAIKRILHLLRPNGILAVCIYSGHHEGKQEREVIEQFSGSLKQQDFDILRYQFANRNDTAPYALIFRKIRDVVLSME